MLRQIFYSINPENLVLGLMFVFILAVLMFLMGRSKFFQRSPPVKTVTAICISLLSVYGLSKTSWNFQNLFYKLGFTEDLMYYFTLIVVLVFFGLTGLIKNYEGKRRWRLYRPLILLGFIITLLSILTKVFYEKTTMLISGIVLLAIGLFLWYRKYKYLKGKKKVEGANWKQKFDYKQSKKKDELAQQQQAQQSQNQQQRVQRQQRLRTERELNKKYRDYYNAIQYIQRKNNGKIPALGTEDGNLRHRYIQAMKAIENLAAQQGIRLRGLKTAKFSKQEKRATNDAKNKQKRLDELQKKYNYLEKKFSYEPDEEKRNKIKREIQPIVDEINRLSRE